MTPSACLQEITRPWLGEECMLFGLIACSFFLNCEGWFGGKEFDLGEIESLPHIKNPVLLPVPSLHDTYDKIYRKLFRRW
jgi:hypothetical protein